MTEYRYRGDRTTRLEHLEKPIETVTSEPAPQPTPEAETAAENAARRIEAIRKGDIPRFETGSAS